MPPSPPSPARGEGVLKVVAPGKLILSGEHAVVYGYPAMAMAVNRYVTVTLAPENRPHIRMMLKDLAHQSYFTYDSLQQLKNKIKRKYHRFVKGEYSIRQVLRKPFELAQFALGVFVDALNIRLPSGVALDIHSSIPMGCGMGSSAATVLCVMTALAEQMKISLTPEALFALALEAEHVQHGRSSGLDLRVAQMGGCLFKEKEIIRERPLPFCEMYLVNTGQPTSSTGECVQQVSPFFTQSTLGDAFAACTKQVEQSIINKNKMGLYDAIKQNNRLLCQIGVVPQKVQIFINEIEKIGGAAKVCGAGSVSGNHAGIVWILGENRAEIEQICDNYSYSLEIVKGEARGVHVYSI